MALLSQEPPGLAPNRDRRDAPPWRVLPLVVVVVSESYIDTQYIEENIKNQSLKLLHYDCFTIYPGTIRWSVDQTSSNASLFAHMPSQAQSEVHRWGTLLHLQLPLQDFLQPQLLSAATPLLTFGRSVQWGAHTLSFSFQIHPNSSVGRYSICLLRHCRTS